MNSMNPRSFSDVDDCVEALVSRVGEKVVVSAPIGLGKPNHLLNALYRRALSDTSLELTIVTGLTIEKLRGKSELETRFLEPFVERIFGDYPELDYAAPYARGQLPENVRVVEFFLRAGAYIDNSSAQRHYVSSNYTHAGRDMLLQGTNVFAQCVSKGDVGGEARFSVSANSDSLDILPT